MAVGRSHATLSLMSTAKGRSPRWFATGVPFTHSLLA
jgi:hypothetical protein